MAPSKKMAPSIDLEALRVTRPLLEVDEYDSYSWVLLEDHPLRSYPTDCPPGLFSWTHRYYAVTKSRWRDRLVPIFCLVLMFLVIVQFLSQLPQIASYALRSVSDEQLPGFVQWSAVPDLGGYGKLACISDNPQAVDPIEYALANGCSGIKADLWLRNHDLLVGTSNSSLENEGEGRTFRSLYITALQEKLNARNYAVGWAADESDSPPVGLFDEDPLKTLTLYLDVRTSMREAWPYLLSHLEALNERGFLSYRTLLQHKEETGIPNIVMRPVTVVVMGRERMSRRISLSEDLKRVIRGLF